MQKTTSKKALPLIIIILLSIAGPLFLLRFSASAAALSNVLVRFDRMKISQGTTGTVCARPTTIASVETDVQVTFPAGYTLGAAGTFTVNTTNLAWPATGGSISTVAAWPGIGTATSVAGQVVTFPSTDLASSSTLYCFNWTNTTAVAITGSASSSNSGTVTTRASGPTTIDTASYSTASLTDDSIIVTATIPQSFSFALSGNTDALGTLSTGSVSVSPTPRTATVNTNAKNGWYVWANDTNTGLNSASSAATISSTTPGSNSTQSAGTAGYNMGATSTQTSGTGTITVATPFVGGSVGRGGGLDTTLRTTASSTGTANNAVLTLTNNAAISAVTPSATDYTDTITIIGAGLF